MTHSGHSASMDSPVARTGERVARPDTLLRLAIGRPAMYMLPIEGGQARWWIRSAGRWVQDDREDSEIRRGMAAPANARPVPGGARARTEKRFSHAEHDAKVTGIFHCVCCGAPLFDTRAKFDSGTGWPSFWTPVSDETIETQPDLRFDDDLTEVICARCDAHLGHVFEDGPEPTGLRYCINGVCLTREDAT